QGAGAGGRACAGDAGRGGLPAGGRAGGAVIASGRQETGQVAEGQDRRQGVWEAGSVKAFLKAEGLVKRYGHIHALRGVDLEVARGRSVVLLGPNGAGKSTLLGILAGRVRPTTGRVTIEDRDIRSGSGWRGQTGYLAHASLVYPGLTAMENLIFYGRLYGLEDPLSRAEEMLRFMGLWDRRNDRAGGFSRGMEQRLAIGRALLHSPDLILLDEPFSGLDYQSSRAFARALEALRDGHRTLVIATHDMDAVGELGEAVVVLGKGKVLHVGPVQPDMKTMYVEILQGSGP
ncbi:MAG: ABC transporter ATP-binding protein, partial [bacterium]